MWYCFWIQECPYLQPDVWLRSDGLRWRISNGHMISIKKSKSHTADMRLIPVIMSHMSCLSGLLVVKCSASWCSIPFEFLFSNTLIVYVSRTTLNFEFLSNEGLPIYIFVSVPVFNIFHTVIFKFEVFIINNTFCFMTQCHIQIKVFLLP